MSELVPYLTQEVLQLSEKICITVNSLSKMHWAKVGIGVNNIRVCIWGIYEGRIELGQWAWTYAHNWSYGAVYYIPCL